MKFERARFVGVFLALLGTGFWPLNATGQSAGSAKTPAVPKIRQVPSVPKESKAWKGSFADGAPLTREKLDEMLAAHREWLSVFPEELVKLWREKTKANVEEENGKTRMEELLASNWGADQGRLILKGAYLRGANLQGANLDKANLHRAILWDANLQGADLRETNLQEADLWRANLQGADLRGTNLQRANLGEANLQEAKLLNANLHRANLSGANLQVAELFFVNLQGANLDKANLQGADVGGANLQGADVGGANLQGVLYEPVPGALPDIVALGTARHLETLRFNEFPHGLEELKSAFREKGMRQREREITHAIKRSEQANAWREGDFLESTFNWVLFDLPVGYGLYQGRALMILGALIPVFALLYGFAIGRSTGNPGIYRIRPKERIEITQSGVRMADDTTIELLRAKGWRIIPHALYFSLLSTFHIGWRELNVGNWISRLQLRPYTLQGTGWLRTVSGIQSLISVYLLAMWALSYFGRPFE